MKKITILFVAFISIMAASCKSNSDNDGNPVITVNNAEEFIKALGNDRTIILNNNEGIYWLTEAIDKLCETSDQLLYGWNLMEGKSDISANRAFDGSELSLFKIQNLIIRGADEGEYTKIYVSPRHADVLVFNYCTNITLENLQLGHYPEKGTCTGDVLSFSDCDGITISNCDLFGCGAIGIEAVLSKNFKINNSIIRDCSENDLWLKDCENFHFYNSKIKSKKYIFCSNSRGISFEKCTLPTSFDESITFINCEFFEWPGFAYPDSGY